jgi:hypothetical protein
MADTDARTTFIIAALVLLVMPIVYMLGLAAAMLAMQFTPLRDASAFMLAFAIVWGIVVMIAILLAARRLSRSARA